ncbi:sarcosine oxidase, gamma subunit family, heterotetrameric form [Rhizobium tibeticum]|uniref:Sarcosine oxidase, gamma subunit family n=1 Tax=Rhizobium tibeticum TaxID=501024 RepID=A0A1H8PKP3_9HYPH|nr:sarcosine oxidase, gamma subunit family [Rhizobium tibeticum]SEO42579.1 sarcosine oxidase, gamma subunit family, heterotetrameric form [Rhizobium tibeticum]
MTWAVDLALSECAVGRSTTTLIGHIAAHITRVDEDAFEIIVLRGFAESLWDDLARMCRRIREAGANLLQSSSMASRSHRGAHLVAAG